jgi:hypothetical protein
VVFLVASIFGITVGRLHDSLLRLVSAAAVGLSVFCMVFAIANPLLQIRNITVAELQSELHNGLATLRVTSILLPSESFRWLCT